MNIYKSFYVTNFPHGHKLQFDTKMSSQTRKLYPLCVKHQTHPLNHWHFNDRMLGILMRYLYFIINNHDLDVYLMFCSVVQFDYVHLNYTEGQGQR